MYEPGPGAADGWPRDPNLQITSLLSISVTIGAPNIQTVQQTDIFPIHSNSIGMIGQSNSHLAVVPIMLPDILSGFIAIFQARLSNSLTYCPGPGPLALFSTLCLCPLLPKGTTFPGPFLRTHSSFGLYVPGAGIPSSRLGRSNLVTREEKDDVGPLRTAAGVETRLDRAVCSAWPLPTLADCMITS